MLENQSRATVLLAGGKQPKKRQVQEDDAQPQGVSLTDTGGVAA